jgi:hypothetical protein
LEVVDESQGHNDPARDHHRAGRLDPRSRYLTCLNASGGRRDEFAEDAEYPRENVPKNRADQIEPMKSNRRIEQ